MFDNLIDFIGKNWSNFLRLPDTLQSVIFAVLVGMAGTILVALFSGSATNQYLLSLGLRPPMQDVPYIQSAVFAWALKLSLIVMVGLTFMFVILMKFAKHKWLKKVMFLVSMASVLGFYGYIFMQLYSPPQFQSLLAEIKHGGFSEIVLYENLIDKTEATHQCQLVLYGADSVICYFPDSKTYTEFPKTFIQRIDY